jgi:hypothetical protein
MRIEQPVESSSANNLLRLLHRVAREDRPVASELRAELAPEIDAVLLKGMAIEPEDRYATPAELALAFRAAVDPRREPVEQTLTPRDPLGMMDTLPEVRAVKR